MCCREKDKDKNKDKDKDKDKDKNEDTLTTGSERCVVARRGGRWFPTLSYISRICKERLEASFFYISFTQQLLFFPKLHPCKSILSH